MVKTFVKMTEENLTIFPPLKGLLFCLLFRVGKWPLMMLTQWQKGVISEYYT